MWLTESSTIIKEEYGKNLSRNLNKVGLNKIEIKKYNGESGGRTHDLGVISTTLYHLAIPPLLIYIYILT